MKIAIFFMVLLTLSAATITTIALASNVALSVPAGQVQAMMSLVDSGAEPQGGDPVVGNGGGGG